MNVKTLLLLSAMFLSPATELFAFRLDFDNAELGRVSRDQQQEMLGGRIISDGTEEVRVISSPVPGEGNAVQVTTNFVSPHGFIKFESTVLGLLEPRTIKPGDWIVVTASSSISPPTTFELFMVNTRGDTFRVTSDELAVLTTDPKVYRWKVEELKTHRRDPTLTDDLWLVPISQFGLIYSDTGGILQGVEHSLVFDNLSILSDIVPEPGSALGLLGLGLLSWNNRKK